MKLSSVVLLSSLGMAGTSLAVWTATPAGGATAEPSRAAVPETAVTDDGVKPGAFTRSGTLQIEARAGHARLSAESPGKTFLLVTTKPATGAAAKPANVNLAVVIDRSGSMKGRRIEHALAAARGMVSRLRDGDVVSVIAYDTQPETLLPATTLDSFSRSRALASLANITPRGDTCISCGLDAAMSALNARTGMVNRILLLSDGEATAGVRDLSGFRGIAERARRMNCPISSIGVDVEYNERVLSALALDSNGRHHFAETELELGRAFDAELASLQATVASNARVMLKLAPGVELERVVDRVFERVGDRLVVPLGSFSNDDEKTLLVELSVARGADGTRPLASVELAWDDIASGRPETLAGDLEIELTSDQKRVTALDPFVAARLGRTRTADTLTESNELIKTGNVEGAKQKIEQALAELREQKRAAAARAPAPKKPALLGDFDKQEKALEKAGDALADPAPPGQSEADRKGKTSVRRNQEVANPFRL